MRLSVVFELLLIFLIIAFAAYGRVVPENKDVWNVGLNNVKEHLKVMGRARQAAPQAAPPNRYCACSNLMCNCCRDFSLPVVPIKGPGCASLKYLKGDQMAVTMSFGDKVLRNTTISGKKPKPVCMALPGGISKFCGRVYGISKDGDQFKACLGLELRALDDVEAALRVSCFRFGPQGMKVEPAQPLPASETLQGEDEDDEDDEDDDDDDDDDYGLGGGGDDDDEDDDDAVDEDAENDVESTGDADYTGLSALSTDFLDSLFGGGGGGEDDETETTAKPTAKPSSAAATTATKSKVTAAPQQLVTEKHGGSAESVTSTSYTVSVVQDTSSSSSSEASAEARPTATAPLDDNPTDRVETVPTPAADKKKDYEDDEDEDDDDDDEEEGDIVSDIIESAASAAANAVGMADAAADQNSTATATTKSAAQAITEEATTAATGGNAFGPAGKDYDDDDEDDDDGFRSLKHVPAAIVPNDRRGRTHRRMRLSSSDESTIHFMKKV